MRSLAISSIVFACVFCGIMLGFLLRRVLPAHHLDSDSKDIVKLATGLIATLSALVLGLLVSSARDSFNQLNDELLRMAVKVVILDRVLAQYGPEAKEVRDLVKSGYSDVAEMLLSGDESRQTKMDNPAELARFEGILAKLRAFSPQNDVQRRLQSRALEISDELTTTRWLLLMKGTGGSVSTPLLVVLVFWLSLIFAAWSVFAPRNLIVTTALLACALSVSGATYLILEMDRPLTGLIRVSSGPVRSALSHLGE